MQDETTPETTHDLLLALAGHVDDDLLAWTRELVAVGEDAHAVELLSATLVADRTALPAPVRAGLLFGGKTVRDERKRMLQRRRSEAKVAVRKHIDEVTFQVGKDSRDMLRRTQRHLRDHFSGLAEEVSTSLAGSVAAAQSAVKTTTSERERRIRDLKAELARISGLQTQARALLADRSDPQPAGAGSGTSLSGTSLSGKAL